MLKVTLESATELLSLDEISANGVGVQAVAGLTGFGLPPVEVQWLEGAGDGAIYRHSKFTPREIDIPLEVWSSSRSNLRNTVQKIGRVMAGRMILRVYDTTDSSYHHYAEVYRTGGGTYAYGEDTDGRYSWRGVVTLRSTSPFFTRSVATTVIREYEAGTVTDHTIAISNPGSAPAYPRIQLNGPVTKFEVHTEGVKRLDWSLASGSASSGVVIDTERALVHSPSSTATSYYSGLNTAPQFVPLNPVTNTVRIKVTYASARTAGGTAMQISFNPRDWMVV